MADDLDDARRLVEEVAGSNGGQLHDTLGEDETTFLCDRTAGCARELIRWTQRACQVAGQERSLVFTDFILTRPSDEETSALHHCAEGAEQMMRELPGNG